MKTQIYCECGTELKIVSGDYFNRYEELAIKVEPCPDCLKRQYEAGIDSVEKE